MEEMENRAGTARMQTSSTGINRRVSGFTLIELCVALAIIVIVSGVAMVSLTGGVADAKMRSGCRMVASSLNYARSFAVSSGKKTRVVFEDGRRIVVETSTPDSATGEEQFTVLTTGAGKSHILPDGLGVTRLVKKSGTQDENWVEFDKSGQSEPCVVEMTGNDMKKRYVVVDPITGRCRIETDVDEVINGSDAGK